MKPIIKQSNQIIECKFRITKKDFLSLQRLAVENKTNVGRELKQAVKIYLKLKQ